jgi:hypothetical protein
MFIHSYCVSRIYGIIFISKNIVSIFPAGVQSTFLHTKKRCWTILQWHWEWLNSNVTLNSVLVQDFVSGRVRPVIQYHYESRQQRVLVQLVHTTGKTWYKVLYHHTMYVISLSNISVKTTFVEVNMSLYWPVK